MDISNKLKSFALLMFCVGKDYSKPYLKDEQRTNNFNRKTHQRVKKLE